MSCNINLPKDSVLGQNRFGGKVYNLSTSFGGYQNSSTLTLKIINENGQYIRPIIRPENLNKIEQIKIGNGKAFHGHLLSYDISNAPATRELSATYTDGSVILDRWFVGLHKRHGDKNSKSNKLNSIIIVGKEYLPCDKNLNSMVDMGDVKPEIDWCDPCPFCPEEKYQDRCEQNDWQIYPVKYSFNELLSKLPFKINFNSQAIDKYSNYVDEFTGDLRSVLQSWCSELSLTFYWDFFKNSLVFVDLSSDLELDFNQFNQLTNCTIIGESETLEGTQSQGSISYVERAGELKDYPCEDSTLIHLNALQISDLYSLNNVRTRNEEEFERYIRNKEVSVALSYYSSTLRDCNWWFNYYRIWNAENAESYLYDMEMRKFAGREEREANEQKVLTELGGMKILQVIKGDAVEGVVRDLFSVEEQERLWESAKKNNPSTKDCKKGIYFCIVEVSDEALAASYENDENLATNFMGRFWARTYSPVLCGGDARFSDVSVETPDGSAEFYANGSNIKNNTFNNLYYDIESNIGLLIGQSEANSNAPKGDRPQDFMKIKGKQFPVTRSFVLAEREGMWYPNKSQSENYQPIIDYYAKNKAFQIVGQNGEEQSDALIQRFITQKYPSQAKNPNLKLILCFSGGFPVTSTKINNFLEVEQQRDVKKTEYINNREAGVNGSNPYLDKTMGRIGLSDRECFWITADGFQMMCPVGGMSRSLRPRDLTMVREYAADGYFGKKFGGTTHKVRVKQDHTVNVFIPKIQDIYWTMPSLLGLKNQINFKSLDQESFDILRTDSCFPNPKQIEKLHKQYHDYLGGGRVDPMKSMEIEAIGVFPHDIGFEQGLETFSITLSDDGPSTSYTISSRIAEPISEGMFQFVLNNFYDRFGKVPLVKPYQISGPAQFKEI